jgi:hypothetical protein
MQAVLMPEVAGYALAALKFSDLDELTIHQRFELMIDSAKTDSDVHAKLSLVERRTSV